MHFRNLLYILMKEKTGMQSIHTVTELYRNEPRLAELTANFEARKSSYSFG